MIFFDLIKQNKCIQSSVIWIIPSTRTNKQLHYSLFPALCQFRKHIFTEILYSSRHIGTASLFFLLTFCLDLTKSHDPGNRWRAVAGANGALFTEMLMVNFQQHWEIIKINSIASIPLWSIFMNSFQKSIEYCLKLGPIGTALVATLSYWQNDQIFRKLYIDQRF